MVNQYMRGLPINDETLAVDLIDRVGPGKNFINEEHTFEHFREVWYSSLFDRTIYAQWLEKGEKRFEERLREKSLKAMSHTPTPLPADVARELDQMAAHWR